MSAKKLSAAEYFAKKIFDLKTKPRAVPLPTKKHKSKKRYNRKRFKDATKSNF